MLGVQLQKDTLGDVQKRLGKADVRHNEQDAGASASATCYVGTDGTVLALISVSEMGLGRHLVTDYCLAASEAKVTYSPIVPEVEVQASGRPKCSRSSVVSKATSTPGGLRLGLTSAEVKALLGEPAKASPSGMTYSGRSAKLNGHVSLRLRIEAGVVTSFLAEIDTL